MKMTRWEFMNWPRRAITLIGMSGLGKTYLSNILDGAGWIHYSCDEIIGVESLAGHLDAPVTKNDLSPLSRFIGKLGDPARGGLPLYEFKRRQKLYYDAERRALRHVPRALSATRKEFVHDSTGSFCEIMDQSAIDAVGDSTLLVYIKANAEEEAKIRQRAVDVPKPLFFPPDKFDEWLEDYMTGTGIDHAEDIDPDDFARWVFPRLFESRLPKYQALADRYGVTIPSESVAGIRNADEFMAVIAGALPE